MPKHSKKLTEREWILIPGEKERFLFSARSILVQTYRSGFSEAHFRHGKGLDENESYRISTAIRDEMLKKVDLEWEIEFLDLAYDIAQEFHAGKTRRSGDPEFSHPVGIAKILLEEFPNPTTFKVIVGLLHDVIEDSKDPVAMKAKILERFRKKTMEKEKELVSKLWFLEASKRLDFMLQFSLEIVEAVDQLSKRKKESFLSAWEVPLLQLERSFENFSNLSEALFPHAFLFWSPLAKPPKNWQEIMKDRADQEYFNRMRSLLENRQFLATLEVKFADKLHNLRTSDSESITRIENIIQETEWEYLPLALLVNQRMYDLLSEEVENLKILRAKRRANEGMEIVLQKYE